jgi:hypothetical protein
MRDEQANEQAASFAPTCLVVVAGLVDEMVVVPLVVLSGVFSGSAPGSGF